MSKVIEKNQLKRVINSYILAQDDPTENLEMLQKYLRKKGFGDVSPNTLKKHIKTQLEEQKEKKELKKMEAQLFKKEKEQKKYRYGSAFCDNCDMYKDYKKECPYCGSLEMTR